jgi:1-acyl-sn-glycerol-3-phosphate acyltransferase
MKLMNRAPAIISAAKNPQVERVFAWINRWMLARHFHQIWATGLDQLRAAIGQRPVLFYANHSNWWDGLIAFYLSYDLLKIDGYLMMLARQLRKYRFFRWIGAFSVDRDSALSAFRSLEYAASLLQQPDRRGHPRALWIFPQGELLPNDIRPLKFLRGLDWLHKTVPTAQLVAIALRYEFLNEQLPEVFLSIEVIDIATIKTAAAANQVSPLAELQAQLTAQLDKLKHQVIQQQTQEFQPILRGKTSLNILYEQVINWGQTNKLLK